MRRLTIAVDAGLVINPDGAANQIEGGAIQATSWTLKERVRFDRLTSPATPGRPIRSCGSPRCPPSTSSSCPATATPRSASARCAQGPTAAAIANALYDAIGVRVRSLPLTAEQIVAAMPD